MRTLEATELRLGNYVAVDNIKHHPLESRCTHEVLEIRKEDTTISLFSTGVTYGQFYKFLKPIILTEKWILKLGFIKDATLDGMYWHKEYERVYIHFVSCINIHLGNKGGSIKMVQYVHELQNVFYWIVESELNLIKQ